MKQEEVERVTVNEAGADTLRLWLRLLSCTNEIEQHVRGHMRQEFATTLPRFDLMAQLGRNPDGLKMSELSQLMMVTGGNVTGITDALESEGLVERVTMPGDRRAWIVRLTHAGKERFEAMAGVHARWIDDWMSSLTPAEQQVLFALLGKLKQGVRAKP